MTSRAGAPPVAAKGLGLLLVVAVIVGGVAALFACSGEGIPAPKVIAPDEQTGACPSGDGVLVSFQERLDAGVFDPLRPAIARILVEERGLATLLTAANAILPELDGEELTAVLGTFTGESGLATLDAVKPHLVNVLEYVHGSSPYLPGEHLAPLAAAHDIVASCEAPASLSVVRDILALEVRPGVGVEPSWVRAVPEEATTSWVHALMDALARAARNDTLKAMLANIEIADDGTPADGTASVRIGRDAFVLLSQLLADNVAAPDFELATTRTLLDDVLLPRIEQDAEAVALLDEVLDLFGILVEPGTATFAGVQTFMRCIDRHDSEAAIPGMLFDYATIDELPVTGLLDDLATVSAEDDGATRAAVLKLLDAGLAHPVVLGDATGVLGKLLEPSAAQPAIGVILALKGTGTLTEVVGFVDVLLHCKGVTP